MKTPPKDIKAAPPRKGDDADEQITTPLQTVAGLFERPPIRAFEDSAKTEITRPEDREDDGEPTHSVDTQVRTSPEHVHAGTRPPRTREVGPMPDLIAFHEEIRRSLERLAGVLGNAKNDVLDVESARHLVEFFEGPLLWHDEDEDVSLLRRLRARELSTMHQSVVDATQRGHEKMESVIDDLLADLRTIAKGAAALDLDAFEANTRALRSLLEGHLTLEETHLFPIVRELLTPLELDEVHKEMRARHGRPTRLSTGVRSRRAVPL